MTISPEKLPCLSSVFWEMNENNILWTDMTMDEGPYPVSLKSFSHEMINLYSSQIKIKVTFKTCLKHGQTLTWQNWV